MISATLITGNEHKLQEWQRLSQGKLELRLQAADLDEIQSIDSIEIVSHKAKQAHELVGQPVIVEDVSAGLDALGGLPGPFIKFFEKQLGADALYQLVRDNDAATVSCTIGYYDGARLILAQGVVHGRAVPARGTNGFGFDSVFVPSGQTKTFAQMSVDEKDRLSHRHLAIEDLLKQLKEL